MANEDDIWGISDKELDEELRELESEDAIYVEIQRKKNTYPAWGDAYSYWHEALTVDEMIYDQHWWTKEAMGARILEARDRILKRRSEGRW